MSEQRAVERVFPKKNAGLGEDAWEIIERCHEEGEAVDGRVLASVNGGFIVTICGATAFLPCSQVDTHPVIDATVAAKICHRFRILEADGESGNVVVSRKLYIEGQRARLFETVANLYAEGDAIHAVVKAVTGKWVVMDVYGVTAFMRNEEISWSGNVAEAVGSIRKGQDMSVMILHLDQVTGYIEVSLKRLSPHPWDLFSHNYEAGQIVTVQVIGSAQYGVFVEVEPGIAGLVHKSGLYWGQETKRKRKRFAQIGKELRARIVGIDRENRRMMFNVRDVDAESVLYYREMHARSERVQGVVFSASKKGLFLDMRYGVRGYIAPSSVPLDGVRSLRGRTLEGRIKRVDMDKEKVELIDWRVLE